jgi:hypothetical protein
LADAYLFKYYHPFGRLLYEANHYFLTYRDEDWKAALYQRANFEAFVSRIAAGIDNLSQGFAVRVRWFYTVTGG